MSSPAVLDGGAEVSAATAPGTAFVVVPSGWTLAARAVAGTAWLLAATALGLQLAHGDTPANVAYWVMDVVSAVVYGAVTLVLLPRTRHPVAWIVVAVALGCALSGATTQYVLLWQSGVDLPAVGAILPLSGWVWVPGTYASMAVLPFVVTEGTVPRWARLAVATAVLAIGLSVLLAAGYDYRGVPANPLALTGDRWTSFATRLWLWPDRWCVLLAFAGVAHLAWRWRQEARERRRGLGWLIIGQLFLTIAFVPVVVSLPDRFVNAATEFSGVTLIVAQAFLPAALLVVVLGRRLWGVDLTVSRATTWYLLTGLVVATYVGVAWLGSRLLPGSQDVAAAAAVCTVAVMGYPLRIRLQRQVDRLVYGPAVDPSALLRSIGTSLREPEDAREMMAQLAESLRRGYGLGLVEIRDERGVPVAHVTKDGWSGGPSYEVPLLVGQQRIGTLRVAARHGERLDPRTTDALGEVAGLVGVSLGLVRANAALGAARDRVIEVRHEERRLLRRELHDGLGPALAGVGLGLAAARRRVGRDPEQAAALLAELEAEVLRRTQDVRQVSRGLLPPELDDGDLDGAIHTLAARFDDHDLTVACELDPALVPGTRRQIAVYHVVAEALLNAHRHAAARHVRIRIGRDGGGAVLAEVTDDGRGLGADDSPGVGTRSMRERAEELGGKLWIEPSVPGPGTTVRLWLP